MADNNRTATAHPTSSRSLYHHHTCSTILLTQHATFGSTNVFGFGVWPLKTCSASLFGPSTVMVRLPSPPLPLPSPPHEDNQSCFAAFVTTAHCNSFRGSSHVFGLSRWARLPPSPQPPLPPVTEQCIPRRGYSSSNRRLTHNIQLEVKGGDWRGRTNNATANTQQPTSTGGKGKHIN